jgi:hypothetical protein
MTRYSLALACADTRARRQRSDPMILWRTLLVAMLAGMAIYTGVVAADHGLNLLTPFFGAIAAMGWQGRFNLDFLTMPVLTGI